MKLQNQFQYIVLPGANPGASVKGAYDQAFAFWYEIWRSTFATLHDTFEFFSDEFTRQDQIGLLLYQGDILACVCFRAVDLDRNASLRDSYFKAWTAEDLLRVRAAGPKTLIGSHFAVSPKARGQLEGHSVKQLMMGLVAWTLAESSCDSLIGTPRRDKSVHRTAFEWGAEVVRESVDTGHSVPVDLVLFNRQKVLSMGRHSQFPLVNEIYSNRKDLSLQSLEVEYQPWVVARVS